MSESVKGKQPQKKTAKSGGVSDKRKEELLRAETKRRHTISIVMFAVGLLLFALSVIGNAAAEEPSAWDSLHAFMFGVFGITAFLVGPAVIYIAALISADMTKATVAKRLVQLLLLLLFISAAAQVIFVGSIGDPEAGSGANAGDTIKYAYESGKLLKGGGTAGLIFGFPLLLFGQVGAIIILILIVFVAFMLIADKSLPDLFRALTTPAHRIKEHHEKAAEERELIRPELERMEEEKRQRREERREEQREQRRQQQAAKREAAMTPEERRRSRFDSIAGVTTGAQQTVTEKDKREAAEIEKMKKDPVEEQKKDSEEFRKDLKDYLNIKYDGEKSRINLQPAFPTEETKPEPYSPDAPKYADESDTDTPEKHLNPVVKHDSLIDPANRAPEPPAVPETGAEEQAPEEQMTAERETELPPPWEDVPPPPEAPPAVPEKNGDIVEAIKDFTEERREQERIDAENAAALAQAAEQERAKLYAVEGDHYTLPTLDLLNDVVHERSDEDINAEIQSNAEKLVSTLKSFGVETKFLEAARGPSVTRYELQPAPGVKISKITGLVDDIALNLATAGVRIEAPIPNKAAVGIEVPNRTVESVPFREMVDTKDFRETKSKLGAVLGKSISGEVVIADIAKMPHILIAGTTGSGKSVCVNSIIMSILFRSTPEEVRLLMIDPKAVEFMIYNGIPHLLIPVVTDPKKASGALAWAVTEMLNRYKLFSDNNVRDLGGYNKLAKTRDDLEPMPQIVIFIDELADLMMASPGEVEDSICRLAQMARAAGMHLVIATQRPSVNVVTGVIKANIPSRIALKVASQVDSRTIIDGAGAEKLLGRGDMLYAPVGMPKPMRVQGCWVSDQEVERVVEFIKNSFVLDYDQSVIEEIERQAELAAQKAEKGGKSRDDGDDADGALEDDKLDEAIEAVIEAGQASTSYLQRRLKLGYGRAARLIDTMEKLGVVGAFEGSKPRQVIMTKQEWYERKMNKDN